MAQVRKQNFNAAPMGNVLQQGISGNRLLPVAIQSNSSSPGPSLAQNSAGGNNCAIQKKQKIRIGTWNVRTLLQVGKLENLKREMDVNRMGIVGLSEVRWEGEGEISSGKYKLFYSGIVQGRNGVGFIVNKRVEKSIKKVVYEGDRIIGLKIGNTWFENPKRRLYTWKSPGNRYRKQIDYILIEDRFKNGMKRVCTLPGADIDSGHNLLMAEVNFRMKKVHKGNRRKKWNLEKLKGKSQVVGEKIAERIKIEGVTSIEEQWKNIREGIKEVVKEEIGFEEGRIAKKPWVTREMLEKMDERRKFKSRTDEEGKKRENRK